MSRVDFGPKPFSYPQPVWIIGTYDEEGRPNAMNAAWGGISGHKEVTISLSPGHKTCANFAVTGAFTINMGDAGHVAACDYVGIASGNKTEGKFEKAGFTAMKSGFVNAPIISELPVCLECRVLEYDPEKHLLRGQIVNVSVEETVMTDGRVDVSKACPITFDPFNNTYHVLGEKVGDAWGTGKALL